MVAKDDTALFELIKIARYSLQDQISSGKVGRRGRYLRLLLASVQMCVTFISVRIFFDRRASHFDENIILAWRMFLQCIEYVWVFSQQIAYCFYMDDMT